MAIVLESLNDSTISAITDREKELLHKLRALLKDAPEFSHRSLNTLVERDYGLRWTDEQLLIFIQLSISNFNASGGAPTNFTINDYPMSITGCIIMGAYIFAILSEATWQAGEAFSYSDNGISLSIDLSGKYLALIGQMKAAYDDSIKTAKQVITRPVGTGIISSAAGAGMGRGITMRSFASRMWVYR